MVKYLCINRLPWHLHLHKHMPWQNQPYPSLAAFILGMTNNEQLALPVFREPPEPQQGTVFLFTVALRADRHPRQIPRAQYLVPSGNGLPPALQQGQRFPAHPPESALEALPHLTKKGFCPKPVTRTSILTPALHCRWQSSPKHASFGELQGGDWSEPSLCCSSTASVSLQWHS